MVKIGNVSIEGKAVLAPMAGVADRAFREICTRFGASYVVSEMVSSKALEFQDKNSRELMVDVYKRQYGNRRTAALPLGHGERHQLRRLQQQWSQKP